jgi:hypothetical protein
MKSFIGKRLSCTLLEDKCREWQGNAQDTRDYLCKWQSLAESIGSELVRYRAEQKRFEAVLSKAMVELLKMQPPEYLGTQCARSVASYRNCIKQIHYEVAEGDSATNDFIRKIKASVEAFEQGVKGLKELGKAVVAIEIGRQEVHQRSRAVR